jgi:hypothetical protein
MSKVKTQIKYIKILKFQRKKIAIAKIFVVWNSFKKSTKCRIFAKAFYVVSRCELFIFFIYYSDFDLKFIKTVPKGSLFEIRKHYIILLILLTAWYKSMSFDSFMNFFLIYFQDEVPGIVSLPDEPAGQQARR